MLELKKLLENYEEDLVVFERNNVIDILFDDFGGYDEDGEEVDRPFIHDDIVTAITSYLDNNAERVIGDEGDIYKHYKLDVYLINLGFTSYDI